MDKCLSQKRSHRKIIWLYFNIIKAKIFKLPEAGTALFFKAGIVWVDEPCLDCYGLVWFPVHDVCEIPPAKPVQMTYVLLYHHAFLHLLFTKGMFSQGCISLENDKIYRCQLSSNIGIIFHQLQSAVILAILSFNWVTHRLPKGFLH